jgi:hypothetical protein
MFMPLDPNTLIEIGTALALGKAKDNTLIGRLFGPSFDYVGQALQNGIAKTHENISRVFAYSLRILESKDDNGGTVNPRILRHIINEGAFCEDELTCAYLGGVLASSRNVDFKDDRGLSFVSVLNSMSSYQIRAHYIFYTILRKKCTGKKINFEREIWKDEMQLYVPFDEFFNSMELDIGNRSQNDTLLSHIFWGLRRFDLISNFVYRKDDSIKAVFPYANSPGLIISPSLFGIELYMWVNGHSDIPPFSFLDKNIEFVNSDILDGMPIGNIVFDYSREKIYFPV